MPGTSSWRQLEYSDAITEPELQLIFNTWRAGRNSWQVTGTPTWLAKNGGINLATTSRHSAAKFIPDVVWNEYEFCVIELKRADVYSDFADFALPEVLHHAWHLKNKVGQHPIPVIVMPCSYYMRSALNYLFAHGLKQNALRYIEATGLTNQHENFLWLYEPFGARQPTTDIPECIPSIWRNKGTEWYVIEGSSTWLGVAKEAFLPSPQTPTTCVFVAKVEGANDKYVLCTIEPTKKECYYFWEKQVEGQLAESSAPHFAIA